MQNAIVPMLGFAAASGTGKTTLLVQLIPILNAKGIRIGMIKHSHHNFQIDVPGKDSYQLREAGASPVMLVSNRRRAIITEISPHLEPILDEQLMFFDQTGIDLILVEGFKSERFPKIELHRPSLAKPLLYPHDKDIIAIATDGELQTPEYLVKLDINKAEMIATFITRQFLGFI
jgi:molybdopterin-guanine dinucleotide biosynthesis adapter protein